MERMKTLLILGLVALAMMAQAPTTRSEQYTPLLSVSTGDIYLTAGAENRIRVTLKNTGGFNIYEVQALLSVPPTTPGISILGGGQQIFNEIPEGESRTYNPTIYVDEKTPMGAYTLTLQLSYFKSFLDAGQYVASSVQLGVVVNSLVRSETKLNLYAEETRLQAGSEETIQLVLENVGSETVYDIEATLSSTTPFISLVEGSRFTEGSLEANGSLTLTPKVSVLRSAPLSVYTLTANVIYNDGEGRSHAQVFTIGLNVDSVRLSKKTTVTVQGVSTEPEAIYPGSALDLDITLRCTGAESYEVKTSLSVGVGGFLSSLSPTLVAVGDMGEGETATVVYRLQVSGKAPAGQYPVTVTLTYIDSLGLPGTVVETVSIRVRGIYQFRLLSDQQLTAERGQIGEIRSDLLLIGTETAQFAQIEVIGEDPFYEVSGSGEYIGPIDPDSPIPFELSFDVREDAELGRHTLRLKVTYMNDMNEAEEQTIEVSVTVVESTQGSQPQSAGGFWIWLRRLFGLTP